MVASKAWENCGVEIEFLGGSHSPTLEKNDINVMGWIENPSQKLRGITLRTPEKGSQPIALHEADVGINSLNLQLKNNPRLLQKVIIHEFGHALGLIHSNYCNDVMSSASACGALIAPLPPIEPTINDIAQCNSLYKNNSDDQNVNFTVIMQKSVIDNLDSDAIVKKFKLTSTLNTSNMHVFDENLKIRKVSSPEEIIFRFYQVRKKHFATRKKYLVDTLTKDLEVLESKVKHLFVSDEEEQA
jgi:hypothetical protein